MKTLSLPRAHKAPSVLQTLGRAATLADVLILSVIAVALVALTLIH
jgi:hypothetical protein